ncbi:hypothetical protein LTR70_007894 [Exophiala xenobiotica]|uniref:Cytochrome P450 n=1 Tax=Lithohypha guttulata TaxID=1690604 RepID=A0ABR0K8Y1_9EURO|nr:hypothetical protein LTR24_005570 [Lithohypha guttulata]KAK5312899.1 hypothetical protein LTR70_007894 [Exophiala xenobiotica]
MLSILFYPLLATGLYIFYLFSAYANNALRAKRTGFPTVHFPLMVQNSFIWMIFGPMSRPWFERNMPAWIYNRTALTVYGVEFFQREKPYEDYVKPQLHSDPKLLGRGKSYFLVTSGRLEFWTWDAEIAKEVTARPNDFRQFDFGSLIMGVFGDNVLTTDGSEWSRHRRIVAGAVTERVSSLVWNESVRQTRALLASISKKERGSESGVTNRMFDMMKRIAIHVLYAAGMGNRQDFDGADAENGGEKLKPGMHLTYMDAVKIINENTAGPTIVPTSILLNWPTWLPGSKWLRELGHAKIEFPQHTRDALAREKQLESQTGHARNNVMSALLSASDRNEGEDAGSGDPGKDSKRKRGPALSEQELVGNLYIFTAAGFDTTANTLSYALILLARHPKWQEWLQEELDALLPTDKSADSDFDYTTIFPHAHRTLALMLETLRLFPSVIHIAKMTQTAQTVRTPTAGTFTIPAQTTIYVNNVVLHTDAAIWRNLNMTPLERAATRDDEDGVLGDEHAFRPSRWLNPSGSATPLFQPPKGTYLPWSSGPRVCPGQKMAQVEFVGVMATLFAGHRMEVVRRDVLVQGAEGVKIPESDQALKERLDGLMGGSTPKLTLEMDVYNIKKGEDRGLGMRWVRR